MIVSDLILLISVFTNVIILFISVFINHISQRNHQLFQEKLRIYSTYTNNVSLSTGDISEEAHRDLIKKHISAKQELVLFAPKNIVEVAARVEPLNFNANKENQKEANEKYNEYLKLLNLMRADMRSSNKSISIENLENLLG